MQANFSVCQVPRIFQRRRATVSHWINRFWSFWKIFVELFRNFAQPFSENKVMDKININKQNNRNARGANRRERRTELNFRARAGQRARTVAPLAKTPAVQMLTISNVPSDLLEAIDELAAKQDRTRSNFVRRELQRIVAEYQAKEALSKSR
jgi:hypothetical protein